MANSSLVFLPRKVARDLTPEDWLARNPLAPPWRVEAYTLWWTRRAEAAIDLATALVRADSASPAAKAALTVFIKADHTSLSKHIELHDGRPHNDSSQCRMSAGTAQTVYLSSATALAELINTMPSSKALALGVSRDISAPDTPFPIVAKGAQQTHSDPAVKTRTLADFFFAPGKPAWCLLDFDTKGMPDSIKDRLNAAGGFEAVLTSVIPGLTRTARVSRASTSAGLRNTVTGETYPGSGGVHLYLQVADGADIPRFLTALFDRLWLEDWGWIVVSEAGSMLTRTLIDGAVDTVLEGKRKISPTTRTRTVLSLT
jgi:hypothetical protein